jgi:ERCC4-type nuclease
MGKEPGFIIAIDTREQKPYKFGKHPVEIVTLQTGDYSIIGLENVICIERKSKADAYGTFGSGRARFKRELERMVWFDFAAIVVESSFEDFLIPPTFSKMHPNSAINSLISWSIRYGVHVLFCGRRKHARTLTFRILEKYHRHRVRLQEG